MDEDIIKYLEGFTLSERDEESVMKLAAVGFAPSEIAAAMEWEPSRQLLFTTAATNPKSRIATLIAAGKVQGRATPQIKLHEAAAAGNIDAIKTLQGLQARNRFNELLTHMDDDELSL